jgi:hypothetical protein
MIVFFNSPRWVHIHGLHLQESRQSMCLLLVVAAAAALTQPVAVEPVVTSINKVFQFPEVRQSTWVLVELAVATAPQQLHRMVPTLYSGLSQQLVADEAAHTTVVRVHQADLVAVAAS